MVVYTYTVHIHYFICIIMYQFHTGIKYNFTFSLLGCIRLGAVWVCWYVPFRAIGQRLYHSCICSCCSRPVKVHPWSLTQALQWTSVYCLCEYYLTQRNKHWMWMSRYMQALLSTTLSFLCADSSRLGYAVAKDSSSNSAGQWCVHCGSHHCQRA